MIKTEEFHVLLCVVLVLCHCRGSASAYFLLIQFVVNLEEIPTSLNLHFFVFT